MANENKWEYDYSSQNNTGGTDTGYPNVGSSGMNTANQYNDPQPQYTAPNVPPMPDAGAGGVTPPVYPAQPQQAQPPKPKKKKKFNGGRVALSAVALVLAAAMGFAGGFVGAKYGGGSKVVIQQVAPSSTASSSDSADSSIAAASSTGTGLTTEQVADMVSPSVVVITTEQVVYSQWSWYGQNQVESGAGSGVIISSDGYILTCDHVVSGASNITVTIGDKDYTATVVGEDSTSDIAVISLSGVVESASIKVAGDQFNEAIVKYMRRKHNLLVGERTAEQMKMQIGCVFPPEEEMTMEVKGRSLITGLPELISVSSAEMLEAFEEPVERIMEEVHLVLEKTPPELVADISNNGIVMTGGGSLVRGFDKLVTARTGIHAMVAENAIQCVAEGTGKSLDSIQDMQDGTMNLSRRKQIN